MASYYPRAFCRAIRPASRASLSYQRRVTPLLRRGLVLPAQQPRLRLGSVAPNFQAKTTHGDIDFHKFLDGKWCVLFSHPADFTPVCTTELGAFARLKPEFDARGVQMIGLSTNDLTSHDEWVSDINKVSNITVQFPIIADADRATGGIAFTIRSVFIIDPAKKIRLTMTYPASTGRNTSEVLRVIDGLELADKKGIATPIDWTTGDDVIVPPSVSTEDAKNKFGDGNVKEVKRYLRFVDGKGI
ncbi:thioredoxin-like protein [Ophiobolus disseminans]|uniref:Thioredoxin-like protein n=1 Tax=Ophiobolus disseminans TaxID=1469910 RepID=A0A6A6ZFD3_9PLEO|nr:thioredoxin-like protein [Ophiobolus disseminans]